MPLYKAQIIGLRKIKNNIGQYYPVFEYTDKYKQSRIYIGQKAIELTPFTMNKKYIIHKKEMDTYEHSERPLSPGFCLMILRVLFMCLVIINPELALLTIVANTTFNCGYFAFCILERYRRIMFKERLDPIKGRVVGYKETRKRNSLGTLKQVYRPLVEYVYDDKSYIHVSSVKYDEQSIEIGTPCNVYVSEKRRKVVDNFEVNAALISIPAISSYDLKDMCHKILGDQNEDEIDAQEIGNIKCHEKLDVPQIIPLREGYYWRVSRW